MSGNSTHPTRCCGEKKKRVRIRTRDDSDIIDVGIDGIDCNNGSDIPNGNVIGSSYGNESFYNYINDICNFSKICPDLFLGK